MVWYVFTLGIASLVSRAGETPHVGLPQGCNATFVGLAVLFTHTQQKGEPAMLDG